MGRKKLKRKEVEHGKNVVDQERVWNEDPENFIKDIPKRAYRLALLGLTNEELAVSFGVSPKTIVKWMKNHPRFNQSVTKGREEADSKVAQSLFKRATGYKIQDTYIAVIKGEIVTHEYTKEFVPDTTAAIFWLKNRQKDKWADVWKMEHTGHIDLQAPENNMSDFSNEELTALKKYGIMKELEKAKLNDNASGRQNSQEDPA